MSVVGVVVNQTSYTMDPNCTTNRELPVCVKDTLRTFLLRYNRMCA